MKSIFYPLLLVLAFHSPASPGVADDSKELRKERQVAQKQRQEKVKERNRKVSDATKDFREYSRDLEADYREQMENMDTELELQTVELEADHEARIASAETEFQEKLSNLFMNPSHGFSEDSLQKLQEESKANADVLFGLKKQSVGELHKALVVNEKRKNALLNERDQKALDEAASPGLTVRYSPILATPIGDGLTRDEERWNEREKNRITRREERKSILAN